MLTKADLQKQLDYVYVDEFFNMLSSAGIQFTKAHDESEYEDLYFENVKTNLRVDVQKLYNNEMDIHSYAIPLLEKHLECICEKVNANKYIVFGMITESVVDLLILGKNIGKHLSIYALANPAINPPEFLLYAASRVAYLEK